MKCKLNKLSKSNVVYESSCPGCESSYIGKTKWTLFERVKEDLTCAIVMRNGKLVGKNRPYLA